MGKRIKRQWPFGDWVPPLFLRHVVSWRMMGWIFDRYHLCWAHMVSWKLGSDQFSLQVDRSCFVPYDYCGWYDNCASRQERADGQRIANERDEIIIRFPG